MNVVKEIERITDLELNNGIIGGITNGSWHDKYKKSAWVYIGGLSYDLTEGDVICVMSQWGEIEDINLVREKGTNKSKGFAFVKYEDQRSTILAVDNFNGVKLLGRVLRCDHVDQYRLPKEVRDKAEELLEEDPSAEVEVGPGHAYKSRQLANGYDVRHGVDLWAPVQDPRNKQRDHHHRRPNYHDDDNDGYGDNLDKSSSKRLEHERRQVCSDDDDKPKSKKNKRSNRDSGEDKKTKHSKKRKHNYDNDLSDGDDVSRGGDRGGDSDRSRSYGSANDADTDINMDNLRGGSSFEPVKIYKPAAAGASVNTKVGLGASLGHASAASLSWRGRRDPSVHATVNSNHATGIGNLVSRKSRESEWSKDGYGGVNRKR